MKRIASTVLCIGMISLIIITSVLSVSAASYDESSYTLTGNQRADIVGVAMTQVGYTESGNNITKYGTWYGNNTSWCDIFVYWCGAKAGVSTDVIPHFGGCSSGIAWFKSQGLWQNSSYTPNPGDLIFFDWGHVGIVEHVESDGSIYIVDGNFSDKVNHRRIYSGGGKWYGKEYITGYGTPVYSDNGQIPDNTENPGTADTDAYYKVATQTDPLNLRSSYSTNSAVVGSIPKDAIFYVSKTIASGGYTWGLTNYSGREAWCALSYANLVANKADISVTGDTTEYSLKKGDRISVNVTVKPDDISAYGVSWSSSNESAVTVSPYGEVTAVAEGTAVITATSTIGSASFSCNVIVHNDTNDTGDTTVRPLGDIDNDGAVTVSDVVMLRRVILSALPLDSELLQVADVDGDGFLTISDVVATRQIIMR